MKKNEALLFISSFQNDTDMHYLCGVKPPEAAVLLQTAEQTVLMASEMECNRFCRTVRPGVTVTCPAQLEMKPLQALSRSVLDLLKIYCVDSVAVSMDFPIGFAEVLRGAGVAVRVSSCSLCPEREVKAAAEIEAVVQSQRAAVAAMQAAVELIAATEIADDGRLRDAQGVLTSERVRAAIHHTLLDHNCTAEGTIVAGGPLSSDPHEYGSGALFAGQPIVIDIFPRSEQSGYFGDLTRTVCRGAAPAALKQQFEAVKEAQSIQLAMLRAGVTGEAVHRAGAERMEALGFKNGEVDGAFQGFIHGTGHGVGLEVHEAPRVSPANQKPLEAGHVVTIEPGLYYADIGGVRIEDTVAITADGYQMLCPCPKELEL